MSIPELLQRQLEEGRALAMEVTSSAAGRRAFVEVLPIGGAPSLEESLRAASATGVIPKAEEFRVRCVEYDAEALDGYDYDRGRVIHAEVSVPTVAAVAIEVEAWGHEVAGLRPYHQTDAP